MIEQIGLEFSLQGEKREIPVEVIYSDRRTMGLEVGRGCVKLRAPKRAADKTIRRFVQEKQRWIIEKYLLMEARQEEQAQKGAPDYVQDPALEARYRRLAREKLDERVRYFAQRMGVDYKKITIRAAKTRWGSCSAVGNLNFHWKLILMPPEVLDYVVVHELAHRKEMNHSPAFCKIVGEILPDHLERRRWLKQYGQTV